MSNTTFNCAMCTEDVCSKTTASTIGFVFIGDNGLALQMLIPVNCTDHITSLYLHCASTYTCPTASIHL